LYLKPPLAVNVGDDLNELLGLKPIYFDLDKSFIRPDAERELIKVIAFMEQFPNAKIDVRSHTDSRADDAYNIALSQRRNTSTIDYIVNVGGISRSRLTSINKWYKAPHFTQLKKLDFLIIFKIRGGLFGVVYKE